MKLINFNTCTFSSALYQIQRYLDVFEDYNEADRLFMDCMTYYFSEFAVIDNVDHEKETEKLYINECISRQEYSQILILKHSIVNKGVEQLNKKIRKMES